MLTTILPSLPRTVYIGLKISYRLNPFETKGDRTPDHILGVSARTNLWPWCDHSISVTRLIWIPWLRNVDIDVWSTVDVRRLDLIIENTDQSKLIAFTRSLDLRSYFYRRCPPILPNFRLSPFTSALVLHSFFSILHSWHLVHAAVSNMVRSFHASDTRCSIVCTEATPNIVISTIRGGIL